MRINRIALCAALVAAGTGHAQGTPAAGSALPPRVEEMPLDTQDPGAVGLLSSQVTGLPPSLWSASDGAVLQGLIGAVEPTVPALQSLMRSLMLAEAAPPAGGGLPYLDARLDWLVENGAVEEALALIQIVGHDNPQLFGRWAELSLLLGRSEPACRAQAAQPSLSDDMALRVFCIARSGDWQRAALVLQTARTIGAIPARRADLLARFLDPELAETAPPLLPPVRPTPLEFRLFEALGEPLPTAPLPLAFSVLDLGGDNGWRAQIEAAERLARAGSLSPNRLLGLYTLRKPAASGGVWDRAQGVQTLERALQSGSTVSVGPALTRLWPQMAHARLLVPFADLFAQRLAQVPLSGRAATLQRRLASLSSSYETLLPAQADAADILTAIARGETTDQPGPLPHAAAIARAFGGAPVPEILQTQLAEGRLGEVILRAIALFDSGAAGNSADLTDALATLRALGLEDTARRAALQLMLLTEDRAL